MAVSTPKEEILAILKGVNTAAESLGRSNATEGSEDRRALLLEAKKLAAALEDPHAEVWPRAFQINVGVCISRSCPSCSWGSVVSFLVLNELHIIHPGHPLLDP